MGVVFGVSHPMFAADGGSSLKGRILVDGSSTVFPISEAVGEEFQILHPQTRVAVAASGTGGGFKKFCKGELDVSGASRPIESSEIESCRASKIDFVELPVAYDGIAIVVNPQNTWATSLTTAELKKIWEPGSVVKNWNQVRAGFPDVRLNLYGPGPDSGTFDYFTKVINQKEKASRTDFTASESDHVIVKGVAGDKGALGYFGVAYYESNKTKLKVVGVDAGKGVMIPTAKAIAEGTYAPLSRPIFIYASKKSLERTEVAAFAKFYIENAGTLSGQVGYVSLGDAIYKTVMERLNARADGSLYEAPDSSKMPLSKLLTSTVISKP